MRAIVGLIQRPGLIRIGFDDLLSALRSRNARCLFGFGESDSDNRAHDALTQALKNPLMDRGRLLAEASNVLVQIAGGPGMTLSEVEILMTELNRHIGDQTQLLFGTAVDGRMGNRLAVTLISSLPADGEVMPQPVFTPAVAKPQPMPAPIVELPELPEAIVSVAPAAEEMASVDEPLVPEPLERALQMIEATFPPSDSLPVFSAPAEVETAPPPPVEEPVAEFIPPAIAPEPEPPQPRVILPKKKVPLVAKEPKAPVEKIAQAKQEVLQFESVTRGRFEKSEPTIVEGQDLDVPTFLRKNVRVK